MTPDTPALRGLNEAQRYAVSLGAGPILVIAGAGSGKTRTLVHRVAHLVESGVNPHAILLLTFTRRAAGEMLARARELAPACAGVEGGTFHSVCHRLLRQYGHHLGLGPRFTVLDQADCEHVIRAVLDDGDLRPRGDKRFPKPGSLVDLMSRARNQELSLEELIEDQASHLLAYLPALQRVVEGYVRSKADQDLVDFDDLLYLTERLLRDFPEVRSGLNRRWEHLLVDEYQDTNAVQARLVELLAGERKNVMAVGDDAQSIYRFRGARIKNILEFPRRFPGTRLVKLEQNYRSTQPILDLTNRIIAGAAEQYQKHLFTERGGGPKPELLRPRDDEGQSREVVARIQRLLDQGAAPTDIAVLFRAANDSFGVEGKLTAAGLPYVKHGGRRFLEAAHIKDALSHLRVLANSRDHLSWERLLLLLPGVGPKKARQIFAFLATNPQAHEPARALAALPASLRGSGFPELLALMERLGQAEISPSLAVEAVLDYYEPLCKLLYEDHPRRLRDLAELPGLARRFESLSEMLAELTLDPPQQRTEETSGERLTLSTIHSAKGLEWGHVFIIWACEGRLPAYPAQKGEEEMEEERRLTYVAATRARQSLTVIAPREWYSRERKLIPMELSRFLEDVGTALEEKDRARPVFRVPELSPDSDAAPPRRGLHADQPFPVGARVRHSAFGEGKVMGYQGKEKILVHFGRFGLKILMLRLANLQSL